MKKLYYQCPQCKEEFQFTKTDLPAGFISPDDLNENKIKLLAIDCPECDQTLIFTLEDVKGALDNPDPEPPKGQWRWFWKE